MAGVETIRQPQSPALAPPGIVGKVLQYWSRASAAARFAIAAALVFLAGMLGSSIWFTHQVSEGITEQTAGTSALFIQTFVDLYIRDLVAEQPLTPDAMDKLRHVLGDTPLGKHVASMKVWSLDGTVIFSTNEDQIGKTFPVTGALADAAKGTMASEFDELSSDENATERKIGVPLLEIYIPVFARDGRGEIAVAEMYIRGDKLSSYVWAKSLQSLLFMGGLTLALLLILTRIARRAAAAIGRRNSELNQRVDQLSALVRENAGLQTEVQAANRDYVELNDRISSRLGADIHDGPGQLLALSLMRIHAAFPKRAKKSEAAAQATIAGALKEAMQELRNISAGLALPEIGRLSPDEAIKLAAESHRRRTGTEVGVDLRGLPDQAAAEVKTTLYRFVQEGLNNAFKHAGGAKQEVVAYFLDGRITIKVRDGGPGFNKDEMARDTNKLGLSGLRHRVLALGGSFDLNTRPGRGTEIAAVIPLPNGRE